MQRWNIRIYSMASKDNLTKNYNYDGNARTSMMYSWRTGSFLLGSMWSGSSNSSIPSESSFSRWSGVQFLSFLLYTATQQDTFLLMLYHSVYYKTRDSKEEWTPVVRKRKKGRRHVSGSSESDSDRSKVDVSCSRLVRYKVCDETPRLTGCFQPRTCYLDTNQSCGCETWRANCCQNEI